MENDVILTQELFAFKVHSIDEHGKIQGSHVGSGQRPLFYAQHAHLFGEL